MNNTENTGSAFKPNKLCMILLIVSLACAAVLAVFELIFVIRSGLPFKGILYILIGLLTIASIVFLFLSVLNDKMQKFWLFGILGLLGSTYLQVLALTQAYYHYAHALFLAAFLILAVHYYLKGKYINDKVRMFTALGGAAVALLVGTILMIIEIVNLIKYENPFYIAYLFADMFFALMYVALFGAIFFYAPNKQAKVKAPEEPAPEA